MYDLQVEWLRELVVRVPIRLVFESALELMGTTKIGTFQVFPVPASVHPSPQFAFPSSPHDCTCSRLAQSRVCCEVF